MSEEKARKDFVGFAEDLGQLRYAVRSAFGLSPTRFLEGLRLRKQIVSANLGTLQQQPQLPQQQQGPACQGQRVRLIDRFPRPLGLLGSFTQPQQAGEPEGAQEGETPLNLTPEELAKVKQAEGEALKRIEEERRKAELAKIKSQWDFSPVLSG